MADKILREKRMPFIQSVSQGTINSLLDKLFEKQVLTQEEMDLVRAGNVTVFTMARALIDNVLRKGPAACQIYINYICECDVFLAGTLGLSSEGASCSSTGPSEMTTRDISVHNFPQSGTSTQDMPALATPLPASLMGQVTDNDTSCGPGTTLKLCSLDFVQRMQQQQIYPMKEMSSQRTRLALIVCNIEFEHLSKRTGADLDVEDMTKLLQDLGYTVEVKQDLTSLDMVMELKAFAVRPEHASSDSTFVVFMSHGIREGICGKKHSEAVPDILHVGQIFQSLNTLNCPNLRDKPKVIIIQACRGVRTGEVWVKDSGARPLVPPEYFEDDFEEDAIRKAHIEKDFIAFCSSTPENISWRSPTRGSLFITKLIENLKAYAWCCDLEDIFRKVRFSFEDPSGRAQMPTAERVTLTKPFFLFPGY